MPSEILKLLVTIPNTFANSNIFDKTDKGPAEYIFKGMTCFQGAHYISFFKRILMKFDYLHCNPNTLSSDLNKMKNEITTATEWTMFDDDKIESKGTWKDLVEFCF